MGGTESKHPRLRILSELIIGLLPADDGRQDGDSLFPLTDVTSQLEPGVKTGYMGRIGPLAVNEQAVAPAIPV